MACSYFQTLGPCLCWLDFCILLPKNASPDPGEALNHPWLKEWPPGPAGAILDFLALACHISYDILWYFMIKFWFHPASNSFQLCYFLMLAWILTLKRQDWSCEGHRPPWHANFVLITAISHHAMPWQAVGSCSISIGQPMGCCHCSQELAKETQLV